MQRSGAPQPPKPRKHHNKFIFLIPPSQFYKNVFGIVRERSEGRRRPNGSFSALSTSAGATRLAAGSMLDHGKVSRIQSATGSSLPPSSSSPPPPPPPPLWASSVSPSGVYLLGVARKQALKVISPVT